MIHLAVLILYTHVTDGQTDGTRGGVRAGPSYYQRAQNGGALRAAYFDITGAPCHCCYAAAADYL